MTLPNQEMATADDLALIEAAAKIEQATNHQSGKTKKVKEEKEELKSTIASLQKQIEDLTSASSNSNPQRGLRVMTPIGQIEADEAAHRGLSKIAQGVWCCPVKVKALINSNTSRKSLACGLLNLFYPKEVLAGKRLKDPDQQVVNAIADKRYKDGWYLYNDMWNSGRAGYIGKQPQVKTPSHMYILLFKKSQANITTSCTKDHSASVKNIMSIACQSTITSDAKQVKQN
ncbi:hypothetical protein ACROYT_G015060 [Oculina patagonica]